MSPPRADSTPTPARPARGRFALAALAAACVLAGCGKGAATQNPAIVARSAGLVSHETVPGTVSVVTKNTARLGGANAVVDATAVARAVFPGLTASTQPLAVVLVDARDWPAALASSALASAPIGAPILFTEGSALPAVSALALKELNPRGDASLEGAKVIAIGAAAHARAAPAATLDIPTAGAGSPGSSASTAAEIERVLTSARRRAPHAVIAVDLNAARALQMPAAGLAAESGAPVVFISGGIVPAATRALLARLEHPAIYVLASTDPAAARAGLSALGRVSLIEAPGQATHGGLPPETASEYAITTARFAAPGFGWNIHEGGHGLVFANSKRPLDAPAAAPLSSHGDYAPLLLLEEASSVPSSLARYLSNIQPGYSETVPPVRSVYNHGWLIGDEAAISVGVQAQLDAMLEVVQRSSTSEEATLGPGE